MPISAEGKKPASWDLASLQVQKEMATHLKGPFEVEMISDSSAVVKVQENEAARIIGKSGKRIEEIERTLGIHIDVQTFDSREEPLAPHIEDTGRHLAIWVGGKPGERVEIGSVARCWTLLRGVLQGLAGA